MPDHIIKTLIALILTMALSTPSLAHKVLAGVYVVDSDAHSATIEGEIGLSNGTMAPAGITVRMYNQAGEQLDETQTREGGVFQFITTQGGDLRFWANLSAGHVMDISLPADELPDQLSASNPSAEPLAPPTESSATDQAALKHLVSRAVADQIRPLRKDLAAYKEAAKWHDVLGGIGYIFGLFGIAAWVQSRRTQPQNQP